MSHPLATPRALADRYVAAVVTLNPLVATSLGLPEGADRLPDLSPAGSEAMAGLQRATLAELDGLPAETDPLERRCARLLRERLTSALAVHDAGEHLRAVGTLNSPVQAVRQVFTLMPTANDEQWDVVAARLHAVPAALEGYRRSLHEGLARELVAGPVLVQAVIEQLEQWLGPPSGESSWFAGHVAAGPEAMRERLGSAAAAATAAVSRLRAWLVDSYRPQALRRGADVVGRDRYGLWARQWNGADLDLSEVYAWGWGEFARLERELRREAGRVLPGAGPAEAMAHLDTHGEAVEGEEAVRARLQQMMDETITALDGVHVDIAGPLRRVESMIAPVGTAAAPYYTRPSADFSRPGRTWLPTMGRTRFPLWDLVSTWYHEGVPGHHLQLAQWVHVAPQLSRYQTSIGSVGADVEGWALYAERLMDELGFLTDPGHRMGYLDCQQLRAVRVVIDIGMHLQLPIPNDQGTGDDFAPGRTWTPALAREFFGRHSGRPAEFLDSELVRYLGTPGQAISYKLGERAWLDGRERARAAHGDAFDLKAWHMAALSQGSLGLDDLVDELALL